MSFKKGQISPRKSVKLSKETKEKIRKANLGKKVTEETKQKISQASKGKKFTKEHRQKISKSNMGRIGGFVNKKHTEKTKTKMSKSQQGCKGSGWKGSISFEPYSVDWTEDLKRAIRKRDKYICQICNQEPAICVHHIDYDKKNCNSNNLITLCNSCHTKTNHKRDYWTKYFKKYE